MQSLLEQLDQLADIGVGPCEYAAARIRELEAEIEALKAKVGSRRRLSDAVPEFGIPVRLFVATNAEWANGEWYFM